MIFGLLQQVWLSSMPKLHAKGGLSERSAQNFSSPVLPALRLLQKTLHLLFFFANLSSCNTTEETTQKASKGSPWAELLWAAEESWVW